MNTTDNKAVTDSRTVAGERKAIVRASQDRQWPKWCVIYPDRATRWFDGENQALLAADDYNGESYL